MSIQRNFIFNTILTVSNYIFPFLIYPYVARVLGVEHLGTVNYIDSVINYAVLFSTLGIGFVGVRKIAEIGDDKELRSRAFSSLFILCFIFTLIVSGVLIFLTFTVEKFASYKPLLLIGLLKLWGNLFLINWLYQGLEDFKFITIRTIAVKFAYLIAVFIFVHKASDYYTYYFLLCMMYVANAVINCVIARRYVSLRFSAKEIIADLKPMVSLGFYLMLTSMYVTFNIFYLGWEAGDTQVGYYTTSTKLFQILLGLYTAYSTVVMPRACSLLAQGDREGFGNIIRKSVNGLILFAIPAGLFMIMYAKQFINIFVGDGYGGSVVPMQIVMPLILIIGYNQVLVVQILTPLSKDSQILTNAAIGASIGVVLNLLLVPHLQAVGSAIVWLSAELSVMISAQIFVTRDIGLKFPLMPILKNIAAYVPFIILSYAICKFSVLNDFMIIICGAVLFAIYFVMIQKYLLQNEIYNLVLEKFSNKLHFLRLLQFKTNVE